MVGGGWEEGRTKRTKRGERKGVPYRSLTRCVAREIRKKKRRAFGASRRAYSYRRSALESHGTELESLTTFLCVSWAGIARRAEANLGPPLLLPCLFFLPSVVWPTLRVAFRYLTVLSHAPFQKETKLREGSSSLDPKGTKAVSCDATGLSLSSSQERLPPSGSILTSSQPISEFRLLRGTRSYEDI